MGNRWTDSFLGIRVLTAHCRIEHQPWLWLLGILWAFGYCCLVLRWDLSWRRKVRVRRPIVRGIRISTLGNEYLYGCYA